VLSPAATPAVKHILGRRLLGLGRARAAELRALEVNAEAMAVAEAVAIRIQQGGGLALFIDYGQDGPYDASLNAIRNHKGVHVLQVRPRAVRCR
jgi:NADH dehydrogenase [ubiquinone] 1 alpha subcomplex assembly factor 7